jgi:hypothetical protein
LCGGSGERQVLLVLVLVLVLVRIDCRHLG